ncbi:hypothetical protein ABW20_dc0106467 [Dactylellina cionopaga]|nr:hypothetical protein ABW20_dc0106467 [Dactylellina cionopaga]
MLKINRFLTANGISVLISLLIVAPIQGYKSYYDLLDAQVVLPRNPNITGDVTFNYTDPAKANENFLVINNTTQGSGNAVTDPGQPGNVVQILSPDGKAIVFVTAGGSLHMKNTPASGDISDTSAYFVADSNTGRILFDQNQRLFHFYTPSMDSYGVSRFRMHNTTSIPNSARMV